MGADLFFFVFCVHRLRAKERQTEHKKLIGGPKPRHTQQNGPRDELKGCGQRPHVGSGKHAKVTRKVRHIHALSALKHPLAPSYVWYYVAEVLARKVCRWSFSILTHDPEK